MKELFFPAIKILDERHGRLIIEYNKEHEVYLRMFVKQLRDNSAGYGSLRLTSPFKPKSNGFRSQNSRIHGHCADISKQCVEPLLSPEQWKLFFKAEAIEDGYPCVEFRGLKVPASLAEASTEQASMVINRINLFADERNYWLTEYDEKGQPYKSVGGRSRKEMEVYNGHRVAKRNCLLL